MASVLATVAARVPTAATFPPQKPTAGLCTREKVHLADGLVMEDIIECPKHSGQFNYKTGAAKGAPACLNLQTYPTKVEGGEVYIGLD